MESVHLVDLEEYLEIVQKPQMQNTIVPWTGTLKLESTGAGTFSYTKTTSGDIETGITSLEISVSSDDGTVDDISATYTGGAIGDVITATIIDASVSTEDNLCTDTFTITEDVDSSDLTYNNMYVTVVDALGKSTYRVN